MRLPSAFLFCLFPHKKFYSYYFNNIIISLLALLADEAVFRLLHWGLSYMKAQPLPPLHSWLRFHRVCDTDSWAKQLAQDNDIAKTHKQQ